MTAPRWDAEDFHRKMMQRTRPTKAPRTRPRKWVLLAAASLIMASVVSAQQIMDGHEPAGVCHATGSTTEPYRLLIVDKNGFEHGHHRHHDHDFFVDATTGSCDAYVAWPDGNETAAAPEESANNTTASEQDAPDDTGSTPANDDANKEAPDDEAAENATEDAPDPGADEPDDTTTEDTPADGQAEGNETEEAPDAGAHGNETQDAPDDAGNATAGGNVTTDDGPDDNGTAAPPDNSTDADDLEAESAPQGDVAITQSVEQDDFEVILTLTVSNIGDESVHGVVLEDALPDLQRAWLLVDAEDGNCVLDGRSLGCFFGDMEPGDEGHVHLRAYTDRMPCGQDVTNTAHVSADDDREARNNAASAGIAARSC